ncbi:MAG: CBS domain-containing protein [Candidatus Binatia bacterium]
MAYGLPTIKENQDQKSLTVLDRLHREVPTCRLGEPLGQAGTRAQQRGFAVCPVVNGSGIVLGVVSEADWHSDPTASVQQLMEPGPTTLRPSAPLQQAAETLKKSGRGAVFVTNSDGQLIGAFLDVSKDEGSRRKEQLPGSDVGS